ncbi:MAG: S8 family serine peptidase, partial [Bdellovibrionales bacterium]|nr:S8 family serine peptidase [Bdellovibrionales bacterium]
MGRFVLGLISFLFAVQPTFADPRENVRDPSILPRPQLPPPSNIDPQKAWHLPAIHIGEVWKVQRGSPETVIAVVDSGIHYNHRDLATNLIRRPPFSDPVPLPAGFKTDIIGWDFVQKDHRPWDRTGHGTYVSGLAAGILGSKDGGAGVCPGCSILTARFMNAEGTGWDEHCLQAMEYAIKSHPAVMNLSFGGEGYDRDYERVLETSLENDVVVVVAAGNDGENNDYNSI